MNDINLILLIPVEMPGYTPGPDHTKTNCEHCNIECWIGPKQRSLQLPATKLCPNCVVGIGMKKEDTVTVRPLDSNAQHKFDLSKMDEVYRWLKEKRN